MHLKLLNWYNLNKRDLPWRNTTDPYQIWLSEIILQQTRVEQGLPYFLKFKSHFQTISEFANADLNDILKLWQGLGYYSRARNMHCSAIYIRDYLNGEFPSNYSDLIKLKGIGPYTAAAIASFAFSEKKAVVDGNVYRVLARYTGNYSDINSTTGKQEFAKLAEQLLDSKNPAVHNQAMMELGAMVCKPQNPDCYNCPLQYSCFAFINNLQKNLPVKSKKVKTRNRYFNYLIFDYNGKTFLNQRGANDIWQGLYEFPLIEKPLFLTEKDVLNELIENFIFESGNKLLINFMENYRHVLTHQILYVSFWKITCDIRPNLDKSFIEIDIDDIKRYAVPKLLEKLITNNKLQHQLF